MNTPANRPKLPFLADFPQLRGLAASVSDAVLLGELGKLAERFNDNAAVEILLSAPRMGLPSEWSSAVAREILLAQSWSMQVPEKLWEAFAGVAPFNNGVQLGAFQGKALAAAAFPTDDLQGAVDSPPPWCLLWLAKDIQSGPDHRAQIQQWKDMANEIRACSVFLTVSSASAQSRSISDYSWTLAAHLAFRALSGSGDIRRQLACDWMVTGKIGGKGVVERVDGIQRKVRIKAARKWMFPPGNSPDVSDHATRIGPMQFPATLDSAWVLLTKAGVVEGGLRQWPEDVEVLHSFTSGAWQPVVASLLLAAPRRLVLWHTREDISAKPAQTLLQLLKERYWLDKPPTVRLERVDSDEDQNVELAKVESRIRGVVEEDLATGRVVLFNVTQGNRMMALAAHALAQLHSNLWLIYRDLDAAPYEFTLIRYEGVLPITETIRDESPTQSNPAARIVSAEGWRALFLKPRSKEPDSADRIRRALRAGRPITKTLLISNSFPFSLIRRKVVAEPLTVAELRDTMHDRPWVSAWGHPNTVAVASEIVAADIRPKVERPALTLTDDELPQLEDQVFTECWLLSPDYTPGFRPAVGQEVSSDKILGWQVVRLKWEEGNP